MSKNYSILLAHYDNDALSEWRAGLEGEGFKVMATASGTDVLKRVEAQAPDALVLDVLLPRLNGLSALKRLKENEATSGFPVLLVLDDGDTYTENRAMICGADAILKRGVDGSLPEGALAAKLRSLLAEQELGAPTEEGGEEASDLQRLLSSAAANLRAENPIVAHITDSLTGLYNADYLELKLNEEYKRARRFGLPLSTIMLGLRASPGDENPEIDARWRRALNEVAGLLLCESRDIDVLARPADDAFCLVLPHTDLKGASAMGERILESIKARGLRVSEDGDECVAAAIGVTTYEGDGVETSEELTRQARHALRQAWRSGGNCSVVYTGEGGEA